MRVILAMAGQAIHRQRRFRDVLDGVAGLAIEATVGPGQRIVRLRVVIVAPALPAVRVVTKRTVQAQAAFMMLVAIDIAGMAEIALDLHMRRSQRIFRLVMIEMNRFPLVLVVTAFALGTVPSGVNVLNPVAVHT